MSENISEGDFVRTPDGTGKVNYVFEKSAALKMIDGIFKGAVSIYFLKDITKIKSGGAK